MTTAAQAFSAVKTRLTGNVGGLTLYWQGDDPPILPDTRAAFAFVTFNNEGSGRGPIAFGGGFGSNVYRNRALVEVFTFSPLGEGADIVAGYAETVAARLRSFRNSDISCTSADVVMIGPGSSISIPGLSAQMVNSYQCAVAEVTLHFDQIG